MVRTSLLCMLAAAVMSAQTSKLETIPLFPDGAPGETGGIGPEKDMTTAKDNIVGGRAVIRLGGVAQPTMTIHPAPKNKNTGAAVVVFPGGGYRILAMDLEGTEVCEWLNSIGVTGVLVKYRVPAREGRPRHAAPLEDAQRAVTLVRSQASKWGIDPAKIGVLGFSAGGHLAAAASNNYDAQSRPDFTVLIYPAYLTVREEPTKVSPELPITDRTPPTIIVQTEDDSVPVEGALFYYAALKKAKVPAEMHLFAKGGHGYGLRSSANPVSGWPKLVEAWMRDLGVIKPLTASSRAR